LRKDVENETGEQIRIMFSLEARQVPEVKRWVQRASSVRPDDRKSNAPHFMRAAVAGAALKR
jgi:hypothetical protein